MIVITGPTASGKSAVALRVAERLRGEIVSADSMQIYKGLDIGTASPSAAERRRIPHHLVDIRYPWESYDAAQFARDARAAARAIEARGAAPLVVGGTALYLKALLEGLFDGPPANAEIRRRLREIAEREGSAALHERLKQVDPDAAARLHPNDRVRLVRALEVFEQTGRPISSLQTQFGAARPGAAAVVVCLTRSLDDLDRRIDARVEAMFAQGLVEETRRALAHPKGLGPSARRALGYQQVLELLAGRCRFRACVQAVKQATRRFARKQLNWFRHFPQAQIAALAAEESPDSAARRVVERIEEFKTAKALDKEGADH